jgi:hypothetical protein
MGFKWARQLEHTNLILQLMEDDQDAHLDNSNYSFMHKSDENYN